VDAWGWHAASATATPSLIGADGARIIALPSAFRDEHAHLNLLAVRPTHQRTGLGTRLVDWLMESAQVAGIAAVSLELRTANDDARRFYLRPRVLSFSPACDRRE
jgi:ribosomal protein S18 acetylase RimI-like enzyme